MPGISARRAVPPDVGNVRLTAAETDFLEGQPSAGPRRHWTSARSSERSWRRCGPRSSGISGGRVQKTGQLPSDSGTETAGISQVEVGGRANSGVAVPGGPIPTPNPGRLCRSTIGSSLRLRSTSERKNRRSSRSSPPRKTLLVLHHLVDEVGDVSPGESNLLECDVLRLGLDERSESGSKDQKDDQVDAVHRFPLALTMRWPRQ